MLHKENIVGCLHVKAELHCRLFFHLYTVLWPMSKSNFAWNIYDSNYFLKGNRIAIVCILLSLIGSQMVLITNLFQMGWIMDNTSFSLAAELFGMEVGSYFVLITSKWIGYIVTFIFNTAGMKYNSSHTLVKI